MEHFTNDEIENELKKILSSSPLSGSAVLSGFLSFIVHKKLEGRESFLKEYTIGVEALKKSPDFNPQVDGIVRIHAGRLRRALKEYYYEEGLNDQVIISIPKGGYVPRFTAGAQKGRTLSAPENVQRIPLSVSYYEKQPELKIFTPDVVNLSSPVSRASIAVTPFKKIGHGEGSEDFAAGMGAFLSTELTRFSNIKVIPFYCGDPFALNPSDVRKLGKELQAEYLLTGSVQFYNEQLRILVQLNLTKRGDQLWAESFEKEQGQDLWGLQKSAVKKVLSAIAGANGIINQHETSKRPHDKGFDIQSLVNRYAQYLLHSDLETILKAKNHYLNVIKKAPGNEVARAFLNEIFTAESVLYGEVRRKNGTGF